MTEHVLGKDAEDGLICPKCECPDVPIRREFEQHLKTRRGKKITVVTRVRECMNSRCGVTFKTTQRIEN